MAKLSLIAAAIVVLTASWVCAGNFEMLAAAGISKPPAPLHIRSGDVVKAEFKSNLNPIRISNWNPTLCSRSRLQPKRPSR